MSSDLNACEPEYSNSRVISYHPELSNVRNISQNEDERYSMSVHASRAGERDPHNTGWLDHKKLYTG